MDTEILGIHHVTAIAGDPQRNVDFYAGMLGLRLVKQTVNFDDPGTYHFYYGDEEGRPGTILTFFPWPGVKHGRQGTGQATTVSFSIPENSLAYWIERFVKHGVDFERPVERFGEQTIAFRDHDGLMLELVAHKAAAGQSGWERGPVPAGHAVRGIHAVTLCVDGYEHSARLLTETMNFHPAGEEGSMFRFAVGDGGPGSLVTLHCTPDFWPGVVAGGTVHHVAWRAADDQSQQEWRGRIAASNLNVTPVLDRQYFRSIYFREPGGVLFEVATDPPGFTVDEPVDKLGTRLRLPSWLEPRRAAIEARLPPLRLPDEGSKEEGR